MSETPQIAVLHGVNLNRLRQRDPSIYGNFTYEELIDSIASSAHQLGLKPHFFQTNAESDYIEELHRAAEFADGLILNPGAWTHYSWAIHDALELTGLPAVEVHISDIENREEWRKHSVIRDICIQTVSGKGQEGYRVALQTLADRLKNGS